MPTFEELRDSEEGPILIVVLEDSWQGFSLDETIDERDLDLMHTLEAMGGIDQSVTPGKYYFNSIAMNHETSIVSLDPVPEDHDIEISWVTDSKR